MPGGMPPVINASTRPSGAKERYVAQQKPPNDCPRMLQRPPELLCGTMAWRTNSASRTMLSALHKVSINSCTLSAARNTPSMHHAVPAAENFQAKPNETACLPEELEVSCLLFWRALAGKVVWGDWGGGSRATLILHRSNRACV
jgi:hypothetical protein